MPTIKTMTQNLINVTASRSRKRSTAAPNRKRHDKLIEIYVESLIKVVSFHSALLNKISDD